MSELKPTDQFHPDQLRGSTLWPKYWVRVRVIWDLNGRAMRRAQDAFFRGPDRPEEFRRKLYDLNSETGRALSALRMEFALLRDDLPRSDAERIGLKVD